MCKRDNVSERKGAAAIAVATPAGHISFGLSGKTNGEKKLAQAVGLVDTLARKAAHGIDVSTLAVGAVIVFKAEPADIAGEVTAVLRLGGDKPHWAEKDEPTMAFMRTGGPGMAKAPPSLEWQLKQLKKIRSDNGAGPAPLPAPLPPSLARSLQIPFSAAPLLSPIPPAPLAA